MEDMSLYKLWINVCKDTDQIVVQETAEASCVSQDEHGPYNTAEDTLNINNIIEEVNVPEAADDFYNTREDTLNINNINEEADNCAEISTTREIHTTTSALAFTSTSIIFLLFQALSINVYFGQKHRQILSRNAAKKKYFM